MLLHKSATPENEKYTYKFFSAGNYSYFMTTGYPWTPIKLNAGTGSTYCSAT
jgi:hypothetical protein